MVKSYIRSWVGISSTIIFPISRWKKALGKCCLTISRGIAIFTVNTSIGTIGCFRIGFAMRISSVQTGLKTSLV